MKIDEAVVNKLPIIVRITTSPESLDKLLFGQLNFVSNYFHVVAISNPGEKLNNVAYRESVQSIAVKMTRKISPIRDLISIFKLILIFKKIKPTIVHTHTPKAGFVGMLAALICNIKYRIHTIAGLPLETRTGIKKIILLWVEKFTYSCATNLLPNSFGLYNYILKNRLTSINKLRVIANGSSNGIDLKHFSRTLLVLNSAKQLKKDLKISNQFVFGFVGRIVKDKGVEELLYAFQIISRNNPNINLILIGDFEDELDPISHNALSILNDNPNIYHFGYQNDVREYFCAMDCFVFPSYREGLPNVILQACALSIPVIATNIIGNTDIITNEVNGILVKPKDVSSLVDAMDKLMKNEEFRSSLAKNSRALIEEKYDRTLIWNEILKFYQDLITP